MKRYPDDTIVTSEPEPTAAKRVAMLTVALIHFDRIPLYEGQNTIGQMVDEHLAQYREDGLPVQSIHLDFPINTNE